MKIKTMLFALVSMLSPLHYVLAESISRAQASELMNECMVFRMQAIEPFKAIAINKCIEEQGKGIEHCERFYKDFGETHVNAIGNMQIGMFWGEPICDKALAVEKHFKMYPSSDKYEDKK